MACLNKVSFFCFAQNVKLVDLSDVPTAIPMIAEPATISAVFTFPEHFGKPVTYTAVKLQFEIACFSCLMQYAQASC